MRALLVLLALAGPAAAQDRCLLACDVITTGEGATARLEAALGVNLPPGARVVGVVEGGFQDAFVQARIEVERDAVVATMKALGIDWSAVDSGPTADMGPPGPPWWEDARRAEAPGEKLWYGPAALPGFASARVGIARGDEQGTVLLLWAFQT